MPKFPEINERQNPTNLKSTENPEKDTHTQAHTHIIVRLLQKNKNKIKRKSSRQPEG